MTRPCLSVTETRMRKHSAQPSVHMRSEGYSNWYVYGCEAAHERYQRNLKWRFSWDDCIWKKLICIIAPAYLDRADQVAVSPVRLCIYWLVFTAYLSNAVVCKENRPFSFQARKRRHTDRQTNSFYKMSAREIIFIALQYMKKK